MLPGRRPRQRQVGQTLSRALAVTGPGREGEVPWGAHRSLQGWKHSRHKHSLVSDQVSVLNRRTKERTARRNPVKDSLGTQSANQAGKPRGALISPQTHCKGNKDTRVQTESCRWNVWVWLQTNLCGGGSGTWGRCARLAIVDGVTLHEVHRVVPFLSMCSASERFHNEHICRVCPNLF